MKTIESSQLTINLSPDGQSSARLKENHSEVATIYWSIDGSVSASIPNGLVSSWLLRELAECMDKITEYILGGFEG